VSWGANVTLYSVHVKSGEVHSLLEAHFVRQAFQWKAFFFGPLWLARHKLWAVLAFWIAAYAALGWAASAVLFGTAAFSVGVALQIFLGLEANHMREAKLAAQGYRLTEIVSAPSLDQAEAAFYGRHGMAHPTDSDLAVPEASKGAP